MASIWRPASISSIPMFEAPKALIGAPVYQSTYTSDYQKRKSLEADNENSDDYLLGNKSLSESMHELSLMKASHASRNRLAYSVDPMHQPLYKTNKYGLLPIHRARKIDGVNFFRSQMDPAAISEARRELESRSLYSIDYTISNSSRKVPGYIKKDGYHHTNSEKNVRYLKSYNGSLIPYIPSLPLHKKPLPPIKATPIHHFEGGEVVNGQAKYNEKLSKSSQDLDKYFTSLQYHQRD
jgi:hypothetical protein